MEQVLRVYGKVLLEAAIVALLLLLLAVGVTDDEGNRGILAMMGAYVGEETIFEGTDFEDFYWESGKSAPVITYVYPVTLYTGNYALGSILKATDYNGGELPIRVRSILDPYGIERIGEYSLDTSQISFAERGIYILKVTATDAWNRTSDREVRIPVND